MIKFFMFETYKFKLMTSLGNTLFRSEQYFFHQDENQIERLTKVRLNEYDSSRLLKHVIKYRDKYHPIKLDHPLKGIQQGSERC